MQKRTNNIVLFGAVLPPVDFKITPGTFPLGLLALASVLKQKGFSVEVISGATRDARERLEKSLADCGYLGISSMTGPYLKMAIEVSKAVKKKYPRLPIIWGGVHATLLAEETIKEEYVDIIVRGMGEESFCRLIEALDKNLSLKDIKGITYKKDGMVISNPDIDVPDINKFPAFDYSHFLPYKNEITEIPYVSSRGCPFGCTFCVASKLHNRRYHFYPAKRMFEEIKGMVDTFGCARITFWDDNLFVVKERLIEFCRLLIDNGLKIKWSAFCHCDLFLGYEDELVGLMRDAGLESISFGAESGSPRILDFINKKITCDQITTCVSRTKRFGINADFTFMTGFPTETIGDFEQTISIFQDMLKINPDISIRLFAFTPYPKIPILEQHPIISKYFPDTIEGWANLTYQDYIPQWADDKHRKRIDNVVWMAHFLSRGQRPRARNRLIDFFLYLYHLDAITRLKTNLLTCAPEWKLFKWFYKINTRFTQQRAVGWLN